VDDFGGMRVSDFLNRASAHHFLRLQPMPTNRITIRQIREPSRLHLSVGLSLREVVQSSLKISRSVAGRDVSLARVGAVDWAMAQTLTDEELETKLCRPALPCSSHQLASDFASVHQELKRAGVTLQLLWGKCAKDNVLAYKYTSFCVKYRRMGHWPQALHAPNPNVGATVFPRA
jgi:hypothetical protein